MVAYSPTQTVAWLECPTKRALYRQGIVARQYGRRELAAVLGQGMASGLEAYNRARLAGEEAHVDDIVAVGQARVAREFAAFDAAERGLDPRDHAQRDAVPERVSKGLRAYMAADPIPSTWAVVGVETPLNGGSARPDLIVDDGRGACALDYKTKLTLKPEYEAREVERWQVSHQLMHYTTLLKATSYYICLLVLEPRFRAVIIPFEVDRDVLVRWARSAERIWAQMAAEDAGAEPWMAATHADVYGRCEYVDYCFGTTYQRERGYVTKARVA
jgi:hypothetical protein